MYSTLDKELDILAFLFKNKVYFAQNKEAFGKYEFSDKMLTLLFKRTRELVDVYKDFPTVSELQVNLTDYMSHNEKFSPIEIDSMCNLITEVYERHTTNVTSKNLDDWLVFQEKTRIANWLENMKPEEVAGNLHNVEKALQQLNLLHFDKDDLGCDLFHESGIDETIKQMEAYNKELCIPTGFTLLDKKLNGGLRKGELCIFMAAPNVGKTAMLVNMAARFVSQGKRVVYLALDNIKSEMKNRLVSCFLEQSVDPASGDYDPEGLKSALSAKTMAFQGKFIIKHYAPLELTKSAIERFLNRLKISLKQQDLDAGVDEEHAGNIDVLIVDYYDLMKSESSSAEFWIAAEQLSMQCKAIALKHDLVFLTATQGGTEAMKAETVQMWQAAGAKSRFNAPDLVYSLSQTHEEKLQEIPVIRVTNLKARRKEVAYSIRMRFDKFKHKIYEDPNQVVVSQFNTSNKPKVASESEYNPFAPKDIDSVLNKFGGKPAPSKEDIQEADNVIKKLTSQEMPEG